MQLDNQQEFKNVECCQFIEFTAQIPKAHEIPNPQQPKIYRTSASTYIIQNQSYYHGQTLFHVNDRGQVLSKFPSTLICNEMHLISQQEIFFLAYQSKRNQLFLTQWNFITDQTIQIPFKNQLQDSCQWMTCFHESKLICILQYRKSTQDQCMKIMKRFYKYPLLTDSDQPVHTFFFSEKCLYPSFLPIKINNHSGIGWVNKLDQGTGTDETLIHIFDIRRQKGFHLIQFKHFFKKKGHGFDSFTNNFWECKLGYIYFKGSVRISDKVKTSKKKQIELKALKQNQKDFHYVYCEKQRQFSLLQVDSKAEVQFTNGFRNIRRYELDDNSSSIKYKRLPTFYVNPETFQVLFSQKGDQKHQNMKDSTSIQTTYSCLDPTSLVESQWSRQEGQKSQFKVKVQKFRQICFPSNIVTTFILTQLMDQPDEEMLYEVCQFISEQEQLLQYGWRKLI